MYVLSGGENKIQCFDLLANKSVPLAESQHRVLERAGFHYQTGEGMGLHPSFTTCVISQSLGPPVLSLHEGHNHTSMEGFGGSSNMMMTIMDTLSWLPISVQLSKSLHIIVLNWHILEL